MGPARAHARPDGGRTEVEVAKSLGLAECASRAATVEHASRTAASPIAWERTTGAVGFPVHGVSTVKSSNHVTESAFVHRPTFPAPEKVESWWSITRLPSQVTTKWSPATSIA